MKKWIGIILAVMLSMMIALPAFAEGEEGADATEQTTEAPAEDPTEEATEAPAEDPTEEATEAPAEDPTEEATEAPAEDPTEEATEAPAEDPTEEATEAPAEDPTEEATTPPDEIVIAPVVEGKNGYKDLLMDTFKQTRFGKKTSLNAQISKILYLDDITVDADNYTHIVRLINETLKENKLSEDATLDHYTEEDFEVAVKIIKGICDELGLGYSIDPSNDSQNEYARVITITKNGKVLGKINSDAKTDIGDRPSIGWIIGGGVLITLAAAFGIALVVIAGRKKRTA